MAKQDEIRKQWFILIIWSVLLVILIVGYSHIMAARLGSDSYNEAGYGLLLLVAVIVVSCFRDSAWRKLRKMKKTSSEKGSSETR
ncbi:hypothetical protein KPC83_01540 [Collinsella sp. zg1085]|uniref:hypothetical protein n=1 Tax=Collinsella sp. zg1085 TaxID=2844380 RepID=UPI001C0DBFD0|nr:hypothetical protein [Collinsella sp. zg1085]QWT17862.1 hypothetical protein KPC83_01540 [Collinsella sp. zg1085]